MNIYRIDENGVRTPYSVDVEHQKARRTTPTPDMCETAEFPAMGYEPDITDGRAAEMLGIVLWFAGVVFGFALGAWLF